LLVFQALVEPGPIKVPTKKPDRYPGRNLPAHVRTKIHVKPTGEKNARPSWRHGRGAWQQPAGPSK